MQHEIPVITIDGPSGSGKGTISYMLADKLCWNYLDSGALYRVLAKFALDNKVAEDNEDKLVGLAKKLPVEFRRCPAKLEVEVILSGDNVSESIRTEECGNFASKIAAIGNVRNALLQRQRDFRQLPGLVADGRDMGTIVFPKADLKIYLDASVSERANRRYLQLKKRGKDVNLAQLEQEVAARDYRDKNRAVAPLKPAIDAKIVDSTGIGINDVFARVIELVESNVVLASSHL